MLALVNEAAAQNTVPIRREYYLLFDGACHVLKLFWFGNCQVCDTIDLKLEVSKRKFVSSLRGHLCIWSL